MIVKLLIFSTFQLASSQMFHEKLSAKERAELFPHFNSELEYEIVTIHSSRIQRRDKGGKNINFEAFNRKINLWLDPLDGILATTATPVYAIKKGFKLTPVENVTRNIYGTLYEDKNQKATVTLREISKDRYELNGVIGAYDVIIHTLPEKYIYSNGAKRRSFANFPIPKNKNVSYHIIQKLPEQSEYLKTFEIALQSLSRSEQRILNTTIYPEILVILDYPLFKMLDGNYFDAVVYTLAVFNGVDLLYRSINNPKIRLNIAGIIIASEVDALEYMDNHLTVKPYFLNVGEALEQKNSWMSILELINPKFINTDVAVTLTSDKFCRIKYTECMSGPIGVSMIGKACSKEEGFNITTRSRSSNTIIQDTTGFQAVVTTAHELGHLFGIHHDGLGDNINCEIESGHIMTPGIMLTNNGSEWSSCSLRELREFLRSDQSACLTNKPTEGQKIPRILPGRLENANQQCQRIAGSDAVYINETICIKLQCIHPRFEIPYASTAAVDGTPCGTEKICLHQYCIEETLIENVLRNVNE